MDNSETKFKQIDITQNLDPTLTSKLIDVEKKGFILKFTISLIALLLGCLLIYLGIISSSEIKFSIGKLNLEINSAYPGLTISIFGLVLMILSKVKIKIKG